jgi:hypothetical protein
MKFSLKPTLLISFGVIFALTLYFARGNLRQDWDDLVETFDIILNNFTSQFNLERSRPINPIDKEENLKMVIGQPFLGFRRVDWEEFWNTLYGVFPLDYSDNERLPPRSRQLTYPEMEKRLKKLYPTPFSYFQDEHWQQFWQVIFGKKAKRR